MGFPNNDFTVDSFWGGFLGNLQTHGATNDCIREGMRREYKYKNRLPSEKIAFAHLPTINVVEGTLG